MPDKPADIAVWSQQLSDPNVNVRREAACRLMQAGANAQSAAVALVRAVSDEDEEVATQVHEALENLGSPPAGAAELLIGLLQDEAPDRGYWAATLLGRLGSDGAVAVQPLSAILQSDSAVAVRERAAWALGEMGPSAIAAREVLESVSRSESGRLRRLALEALDQIAGKSAS